MKLRIKGNTIRLRLTKSEVDYFSSKLLIEETTEFIDNPFTYSLHAADAQMVSASFENNQLKVIMPVNMAKDWTTSNLVGCSGEMEVLNGKKIYILIEKDFKCLDEVVEDQSDNYDNPLSAKK